MLAQLSFNTNINKELSTDNGLIQTIEDIKKRTSFDFLRLKKTAEELIWLIKPKNISIEDCSLEKKINDEHIMISYNSASRDMCLKIKAFLEKLNHRVWIDVEGIHGN